MGDYPHTVPTVTGDSKSGWRSPTPEAGGVRPFPSTPGAAGESTCRPDGRPPRAVPLERGAEGWKVHEAYRKCPLFKLDQVSFHGLEPGSPHHNTALCPPGTGQRSSLRGELWPRLTEAGPRPTPANQQLCVLFVRETKWIPVYERVRSALHC